MNEKGVASIFLIIILLGVLALFAVTLFTDLIIQNPVINILTTSESKNSTTEIPDINQVIQNPDNLSPTPTLTVGGRVKCEKDADCEFLNSCNEDNSLCAIGKCLINTCVSENVYY